MGLREGAVRDTLYAEPIYSTTRLLCRPCVRLRQCACSCVQTRARASRTRMLQCVVTKHFFGAQIETEQREWNETKTNMYIYVSMCIDIFILFGRIFVTHVK